MTRKKLIICAIVSLISVFSFAQKQELTLTGSYTNEKFDSFIQDAENQLDVRFYYLNQWTDSIIVNGSWRDVLLDTVLKDILPEDIFFYIDEYNNIIITKQYAVQEQVIEKRIEEPILYVTEEYEEENGYHEEEEDIQFTVLEIGNKGGRIKGGKAVVSGYIKDRNTGEGVINAVLYIDELKAGTASNQYGFYTIELPVGEYQAVIRSIGWKETIRQIKLISDGTLNIEMEEELIPLEEVVISAKRDENLERTVVGLEKISVKEMKLMPTSMGEVDIMKSTLALPGVKSVGEGAAGINVRGGAADQNLVLMYDVPLFNSSHFFGFFSALNPEIVKDVSLYKGGIPAKYGGRTSAVLDVLIKDGNKNKISAKGGISPITAQLTIEGPLQKEKSSFLIAGRTTYSNWLLSLMQDPNLRNSRASFYDINTKFVFDLNDKNMLEISGYTGSDDFKFSYDTSYSYNSNLASIKWRHHYKQNMHSVVALNYSEYDYSMVSDRVERNSFDQGHQVQYYNLKADFNSPIGQKHRLSFGGDIGWYGINPGTLSPYKSESLVRYLDLEDEQALTGNLYLEDEFKIAYNFTINVGIRLSSFNYLGPKDVYSYGNNSEMTTETLIDTAQYDNFQNIQNYIGPEYRASLNYMIGRHSSVKLNYNRTRQYIHLLSNSVAVSPTAIWKLSDQYIKPVIGDQIALGYYRNFKNGLYQAQIETYYKQMKNMIDYKGGTKVELNEQIETTLLFGEGYAYGVELMIKKTRGRLNGWFNYTYSRVMMKSTGDHLNEIVNNGDYYPASYDQPHDLNLVMNYKFSRRFSFSTNFTYSTGRPITYPVSTYIFDGQQFIEYSDRNQYRIPDYIRWDISFTLDSNLKKEKWFHSTWSFSVYNLLGRSNAYSVYFKNENGSVNGYKLSVFAQPIPTITYNFNF